MLMSSSQRADPPIFALFNGTTAVLTMYLPYTAQLHGGRIRDNTTTRGYSHLGKRTNRSLIGSLTEKASASKLNERV